MKREQVLPHVMADMAARIAKGADEYGEPLTTFNGRDALQDSYEEALDLAVYLKQAIMERDAKAWPEAQESENWMVRTESAPWPGPDWSQAPEGATGWVCEHDGKGRWIFGDGRFTSYGEWVSVSRRVSHSAPSFNYPGDWRDSLRKRPK
jgi:hypothetical protein